MKKRFVSVALVCVLALVSLCAEGYPILPDTLGVRNVILFIGDGMGIAQTTVARVVRYEADGRLWMERMPVVGLVNTHSADDLITDSAGGATALATGYKTRRKMIGVLPDGREARTILEACRDRGMATGIVVLSSVTDATPAGFTAHTLCRDNEEEIASDIIEGHFNVVLGGGKQFFLPVGKGKGKRRDGRDLIAEGEQGGYTFIQTKDALISFQGDYVLGLFAWDDFKGDVNEPSLCEMTLKALEVLSRDEDGFFLMVEGSGIDWACHRNNTQKMVEEVLSFDDAVKVGLDFAAQDSHTLVIVVADHECGGMAIEGGALDGRDLDIDWATRRHTGVPIAMYVFGPGAIYFTGVHDNTDIPKIIAELLGLEDFPQLRR